MSVIDRRATVAAGAMLAATVSLGGCSMQAQTTQLFTPEDLDGAVRTREFAEGDLNALRAVANWTKAFVASPNPDLGRAGTVCPFVPVALERRTLWLAPERSAGRTAADVVQLMNGYKQLLLAAQPIAGDEAAYKSISVVFTDLPAARAKDFFDPILQQLVVPSYVNEGIVMGPFYEGNEGTAIYNRSFRPFTSPAPFLLMRQAVVSDWKFFLDDEAWLTRWAQRYGEAGTLALAEQLRRMPWRTHA